MTHLETITALLRENAPAALHRDGDRLHAGPACTYANPQQQQPLTAEKAVDLAFLGLLPALCPSCESTEPWLPTLDWTARWLPRNAFGHRRNFNSLLLTRTGVTASWLYADPRTPGTCCNRRHREAATWDSDVEAALAELTHTHLHAAAAEHGPPTDWVAIALQYLEPTTDGPAASPLDRVGLFHAWASTRVQHVGGVAIFHLPADLAEVARAYGAGALDPAHLTPETWALAERLLTDALATPGDRESHRQREVRTARDAGQLFEVAHAATH